MWIALLVNALMFGVEIAAGLRSGSVSLLADASPLRYWVCTWCGAPGRRW